MALYYFVYCSCDFKLLFMHGLKKKEKNMTLQNSDTKF